jgi:hypothetical protein
MLPMLEVVLDARSEQHLADVREVLGLRAVEAEAGQSCAAGEAARGGAQVHLLPDASGASVALRS